MKIIKITFLQTFMYNESFMYKIYLQDPDNSNQSIACLTHDSNEALDILVGYRNKIMEKNYKWITDFISILIPTNDEDEAMDIFLKYRYKMIDSDLRTLNGKCEINHLETKYSDHFIKPNNILQSMKRKNSSLNNLIDNLKLEIIL